MTNKIINLSSPILEVVDFINESDIQDVVSLLRDANGDVYFLSSIKDIGFLSFLKLELEEAISDLIYEKYSQLEE